MTTAKELSHCQEEDRTQSLGIPGDNDKVRSLVWVCRTLSVRSRKNRWETRKFLVRELLRNLATERPHCVEVSGTMSGCVCRICVVPTSLPIIDVTDGILLGTSVPFQEPKTVEKPDDGVAVKRQRLW